MATDTKRSGEDIEEESNPFEDVRESMKKSHSNYKKTSKARRTAIYIDIQIRTLNERWQEAKQIKIENIKPGSTRKDKSEIREKFQEIEDMYFSHECELREALKEINSEQTAEKHSNQDITTEKKTRHTHLAPIQIPKFNGEYEKWTEFHDLFKSLVHQNPQLTDVERMHHLKTNLTGEAASLISHLSINENNYNIAWERLNERFDDKRIIIDNILDRLIDQKVIYRATDKTIKDLSNNISESLSMLKNYGINVENWDCIIIRLTVKKLDWQSRKEWETEMGRLKHNELPTTEQLKDFLQRRFKLLETVPEYVKQTINNFKPKAFHINNTKLCGICNENHDIYACEDFIKLNLEKRTEIVKNNKLCYNCLKKGHNVKECKNLSRCKECNKKHNTMLHLKNLQINKESTNIISHHTNLNSTALMATAIVQVRHQNRKYNLRALLDPCSQESFISESAAQLLNLGKRRVNGHISGIGSMKTQIKFKSNLEISSIVKPVHNIKINVYGVDQITSIMPAKKLNIDKWNHLSNIELADPYYNTPGKIDLLLGIEVFNEIICPGLIKGQKGTPTAVQTKFGWILSGKINDTTENNEPIVSLHLNVDLNNTLKRFWELENIEENESSLTTEELRAEEIYKKTTIRDQTGRYAVKLPFKEDNPILPSKSREIALERWKNTEKRLERNAELKIEYHKIIKEYIQLGILKEINSEKEINDIKHVYLPQLPIIKKERETTKVRIVGDGSSPGTNGISLNDTLITGPFLNEDLRIIITRWRFHKVAFTADIEKMYLQVKIQEEQQDFQRIVWRENPREKIKDLKFTTVTFGTSCAPYLAIKTLKQIAFDECKDDPEVKDKILNDFYVDDLISGHENSEQAIRMYQKLTEKLRSGGFTLRKWSSNDKQVTEAINNTLLLKESEVNIMKRDNIKTLGLLWNIHSDNLTINNNITQEEHQTVSKRSVLKEIASLFDPMGWIAPIVITAKIFIQKLWKIQINWDDKLDNKLKSEWIKFKSELKYSKVIKINRWIFTNYNNLKTLEIHGFADASEAAYAAVLYSRVQTEDGRYQISLLTAKTRVAPLKQITLPRLELCAATLLSSLLSQHTKSLNINKEKIHAWSDSQIVLAWIKGDPIKWKTFVKNRIIEIQNKTLKENWHYINTKQNPADAASRGISPAKMSAHSLWWEGPEFLKHKLSYNKESQETDMNIATFASTIEENPVNKNDLEDLFTKYSSIGKLLRVLAYCKRWLIVLKKKKIKELPPFITKQERDECLTICIKITQKLEFRDEIEEIKRTKLVKSKSKLLSLSPFLDEEGILRVGGRLKHSNLNFTQKHPIIISKTNLLVPLILTEAHKSTAHGGTQLMASFIRGKFWIINAMNKIKRFTRNCTICIRQRISSKHQMMGDLPSNRVKPSKPFIISGVDFAGPIRIKINPRRGSVTQKAYICLFVCLSTKAIHLELVSDMTTKSFIAALRRFISRRGRVTEIWSDNGTNFVGAKKELINMWRSGSKRIPWEIESGLDQQGISWKFIPPGAPNFGGLWEAGIKSAKTHLKRIIGNSNLTFEEMYTVLTQVEACLNSRPLTKLSDHPDDLEPLTPGHLLIGESLVNIPSPEITQTNLNSLDRWKRTTKMTQDFWKRWQTEYLNTLQQRSKWKKPQREFNIGDIVIIKDNRFSSGHWPLGKIVKKYPGQDEMTRTYDIQTSNEILKRPISKLCPLVYNVN